MKKIVKAVLFLILCFTCLEIISKILAYEHEMEPDLTMKEFYGLEEDTVQILIVGSSHTELGFSPIECYKQYQITSYNFSTAKQPIELSYYLMEEGLKKHSPQVVIYDVASLFYDDSDVNTARFRYVLDSMPLSVNKVKLAQCYADYNSDERIFSIAEALCPIYYYHDRWKKLDEEEFNIDEQTSYLKGQFMRTYINEVEYDVEKIETKIAKKIANGTATAPTISDKNMSYLLKMKKLCDENNMQLLLITTPTVRWNSLKSGTVEEICKANGLNFVDLNMPDGELIDYSVDMADGNHVNAYGAKKTTKYLCDYIIENYGIKGKACDDYDESIKYYDAYDNILKYQLETDFDEYLSMLNENKKDLAIFICANNEMTAGLQDKDIQLLNTLGCKITFDISYNGQSYIAVTDGGKLVYEKADKAILSYKYNLENGSKVKLTSAGKLAGSFATIDVDGKSYGINSMGLNIVIYDKESNTVLDSVAFNTNSADRKWYRSDDRELEIFMFKTYRDWVLENY